MTGITGPFPAFYQGYGVPFDGVDDDERTKRRPRRSRPQVKRTRTRRK
jgi:hypothetical protein